MHSCLTHRLGVIFLLLWADEVWSAYEVEVTFHSYQNPTGRCVRCHGENTPPRCCDGVVTREDCTMEDTCDTTIDYCFKRLGSTNPCPNGSVRFSSMFIEDTNNYIFETSFFGLDNPAIVASDGPWTGFQIFLIVTDCNVDREECPLSQIIDGIAVDINVTVGASSPETTYTGNAGIAHLNVSFEVRCAADYYGQDCLTFCPDFQSCAECNSSLSGFTGGFCHLNINDCEGVDCNNGICVDEVNNFVCECGVGFTGEFCQLNIDDCVGAECNNGDCVDGINNYVCECNFGFTGGNCSVNIDDCEGVDCSGNGGCVDETDGFVCVCEVGFAGDTCDDIDHCVSIFCSGNGVCTNSPDSFTCNCEDGYTGVLCAENSLPSSSSRVGGIAGGVVGVIGVALLAIIIVVVLLVLLRNRSHKNTHSLNRSETKTSEVYPAENPSYGVLDGNNAQAATSHHGNTSTMQAAGSNHGQSMEERDFDNPLYSDHNNMVTEDPYTVPDSPPVIYDQVASDNPVVVGIGTPSSLHLYSTITT